MGVDYSAKAGVGFSIYYHSLQRSEIMNKLDDLCDQENIEDFIDEFEGDFKILSAGDYCYTGDIDSLIIMIVKNNYKDSDTKFIEDINNFFGVEFKESDIDIVSEVDVW